MIRLLKKIHSLLAVTYLTVSSYLLVFNWSLCATSLSINYGFGTFNAPPILLMMVFGMVVVALIWFVDYTKDLRVEVDMLNGVKKRAGAELEHADLLQKQLADLNDRLRRLENDQQIMDTVESRYCGLS